MIVAIIIGVVVAFASGNPLAGVGVAIGWMVLALLMDGGSHD